MQEQWGGVQFCSFVTRFLLLNRSFCSNLNTCYAHSGLVKKSSSCTKVNVFTWQVFFHYFFIIVISEAFIQMASCYYIFSCLYDCFILKNLIIFMKKHIKEKWVDVMPHKTRKAYFYQREEIILNTRHLKIPEVKKPSDRYLYNFIYLFFS